MKKMMMALTLLASSVAMAHDYVITLDAQKLDCGGMMSLSRDEQGRYALIVQKSENSTCAQMAFRGQIIELDTQVKFVALNVQTASVVDVLIHNQAVILKSNNAQTPTVIVAESRDDNDAVRREQLEIQRRRDAREQYEYQQRRDRENAEAAGVAVAVGVEATAVAIEAVGSGER